MVSSDRKRVLCVDDKGDDCELFSFILSQAGYEVELAQSIRAALQLLECNQFNLCLLDLSLPDGSGFEVLEKIQSINSTMPIIVCSGDARNTTRIEVMQAGAQAFFTKPIDFDSLIKTIAQIFSHSRQATLTWSFLLSHIAISFIQTTNG